MSPEKKADSESKLGQRIKCKQCHQKQAVITLEEGRYMVECAFCRMKCYLKEYHII